MRDIIAGIVAIALLLVAASLATTLQAYRRRRERARDSEGALGRRIIAELPGADDLVLVSEDDKRFYYGDRCVDKDLIVAVRLLINGAQIAAHASRQHLTSGESTADIATSGGGAPGVIEDRPEGIARDRWDVALETFGGTVLIECGAVRERVSQELARTIFEAVKRDMEVWDR